MSRPPSKRPRWSGSTRQTSVSRDYKSGYSTYRDLPKDSERDYTEHRSRDRESTSRREYSRYESYPSSRHRSRSRESKRRKHYRDDYTNRSLDEHRYSHSDRRDKYSSRDRDRTRDRSWSRDRTSSFNSRRERYVSPHSSLSYRKSRFDSAKSQSPSGSKSSSISSSHSRSRSHSPSRSKSKSTSVSKVKRKNKHEDDVTPEDYMEIDHSTKPINSLGPKGDRSSKNKSGELKSSSTSKSRSTSKKGRNTGKGKLCGDDSAGEKKTKESQSKRHRKKSHSEEPKYHRDVEKMMAQMRSVMGFGKFRSTKNTKVPGNDRNYAVRVVKMTRYRQYMNRPGGFNRPLSPS